MLTKEQNDTLTLTGPGTPGGALLRRFWQPIALAKELPNGGDPLPIPDNAKNPADPAWANAIQR